jgi:hypothetical protein
MASGQWEAFHLRQGRQSAVEQRIMAVVNFLRWLVQTILRQQSSISHGADPDLEARPSGENWPQSFDQRVEYLGSCGNRRGACSI